jgi:hypothetical protein
MAFAIKVQRIPMARCHLQVRDATYTKRLPQKPFGVGPLNRGRDRR